MIPHLFAFGFASPWLLWGLVAAGAPVLIHLLNRRKFQETQWAAMRFLLEAVRKNARRIRVEQFVLLAVRTLLLLLIVLAMARPFVEQLGVYFQADLPAHKIIVIDASLSMAYQPAETSLFDRAKETAREIVGNSTQGDAINLVRLSNLPPSVIVQTPSYQPADVIEEIDQLTLPHGEGNLLDCLQKVQGLLEAAPQLQKEIYLISDFQRVTWTAGTTDAAARIRELLKTFDERAHVVLVDVGQNAADNLAITDFASQDPFATVARPVRFKVTLRNFGPQRLVEQPLELLVDGKVIEQRRVSLNAGGEATEYFAHTFEFGGEHRLQVRLQKDHLAIDDQRWLSVPVKDRIAVLCINGQNSGRAMGKATDYLELALSPATGSGLSARNLIQPYVISEGELVGVDLSKFDCVFVCNVGLFTQREADILSTFLRGGGGVVWCLGDKVQADSYNQLLFKDGQGILPAKLGNRIGDPVKRARAFEFAADDFAHPIISAFRGNPDAGLETTRTYAYIDATIPEKSVSRVALRFDTQDPAIIEASVGMGKSVLVTTSVDDRWGNWALWPSFVPMMNELVFYAVSGRWGERQHLVGEPLSQILQSGAADVAVAVDRPDGQSFPVRISQDNAFSRYTFDATGISGVYEVQLGHPFSRTELFAVNIDPRESDPAKLTQEELADELFAGLNMEYHTQWEEDGAKTAPTTAQRGGLTRWLLYAALYLVFVEQMLAWNFRYGLWMLCPLLVPFQMRGR